MGASSQSKRHAAHSEINVTPFVDVMLVLLIIFMVTAPMLQQGIKVKLPETTSSGTETQSNTFVLSINSKNKIFLAESPVSLSQLKTKLNAIFKTRKNKQLYIKADEAASYGLVAKALAEVRAAGISNIGLVTIPKGQ